MTSLQGGQGEGKMWRKQQDQYDALTTFKADSSKAICARCNHTAADHWPTEDAPNYGDPAPCMKELDGRLPGAHRTCQCEAFTTVKAEGAG